MYKQKKCKYDDNETNTVKVEHNNTSGDDEVTAAMIRAVVPVGIQWIYINIRKIWQMGC
jgi:hypothetical protein